MCNAGDAEGGFRSGSWVRARRSRKCYACGEMVRAGDLYHREAGQQDDDFFCYTHCARCWKMLDFLSTRSYDGTVAYNLDCGVEWKYGIGREDITARHLAFMTPDEGQTYAKRWVQR